MSLSLKSVSAESLANLSARDQRKLLIGAAIAVVILIFLILIPLDRSVAHAQSRLAKKKGDLAYMQDVAPEIRGGVPPGVPSGESLLVIVDRSARELNLGNSLAGSDPGASGSLSVRLNHAPFDTLVVWLGRLAQQNGVTVDSATIEKAGAPGLVNAAIVLHSG
jgi:general secretion pathway protein M